MGREQLTGALLDRLAHWVHILEMNGESFRFRESVRRVGEKPTSSERTRVDKTKNHQKKRKTLRV